MRDLVEKLVSGWGSPIVARRQAGRFSGGSISPRTLANLDCRGLGPEGRFMVGKNVVYPTESLARWIAEQVKERAA